MTLEESSILFKNKEEIEFEISELDSMLSEFKDVKDVLNRLPRKIQHEIMVPLGPLAFVPGYIVNTNKVLILLGTDFYAERTTYESLKTIDRRILQAEECLESLKKNLFKIEESIALKNEFNRGSDNYSENISFRDGLAEIREELDDSEEFLPPPPISNSKLTPYIPDSHVDSTEKLDNLESNFSDFNLNETETYSKDKNQPISIFKQRILEKKGK